MKRKGMTVIEVLMMVFCIVLLTLVLMPCVRRSRQMMLRLMCQTNLRDIGSVLEVFAGDNEGRYPRAGGEGSTWLSNGLLSSWDGGPRGTPLQKHDRAFMILRDPTTLEIITPGQATITSSWYMLVKHYGVQPKQFVCKSDEGASEFEFSDHRTRARSLEDVFDFGAGDGGRDRPLPMPGEVVSYAYQMPYSFGPVADNYGVTVYSSPASPVAADRNPFLDKNATGVDPNSNSAVHLGVGQNVLYKDGSVRFEGSPHVGIGGDNIYTYGGGPEGTGPAGNGDGAPVDKNDAYLVSELNDR